MQFVQIEIAVGGTDAVAAMCEGTRTRMFSREKNPSRLNGPSLLVGNQATAETRSSAAMNLHAFFQALLCLVKE